MPKSFEKMVHPLAPKHQSTQALTQPSTHSPSAALCPKVLREDDLHVPHKLAVPQRLEHKVGEAQHRQVLNQLLAQIVVDAVDLVLWTKKAGTS